MRISLFCWMNGCLAAMIALAPLGVSAAELTRNIERNYPASAHSGLEIRSSGGAVKVQPSTKSEIEIFITIRARAATEEAAQAYLDQVEIRERQFGDQLQLETQALGQRLWQVGGNDDLEVIYEVFLPESHALEVQLKRGDIDLGNRGGNVDIELSHGDLIADTLYGNGNRLELHRGKARIDSVGGMDLQLSLAELDLGAAGELYLRSQTAKVKVGRVGNLDLVAHLGELTLGWVGDVQGRYTSSQCSIETLARSLDLDVKYAPALEIETVQAGFSRIDLRGNATGMRLGVEPSASFELEAEMAYGELEAKDWKDEIEEEKTSSNGKIYRKVADATARSRTAPGLITIDNRYGRVKITQKAGMKY
ncbi:MAG: hypothetical protein AAF399_04365 [Bacteroidota bacterium]